MDLSDDTHEWLIDIGGTGEVFFYDSRWYWRDAAGLISQCGTRDRKCLARLFQSGLVCLIPISLDPADDVDPPVGDRSGWARAALTVPGEARRAELGVSGARIDDLPLGAPADLRAAVLAAADLLRRASRTASDILVSGVRDDAVRPLICAQEALHAAAASVELAGHVLPVDVARDRPVGLKAEA